MKRLITLCTVLLCCIGAAAQASFIVKDTLYQTYPFSDPDPVPAPGKIYPYPRYGTFSFIPSPQTWKMVVLENDCLRVRILPEIGGKVWSVYDKVNGRELFYDNDVVKFREISLRGPWTSGGIEFNYGVIGHAPTCSHPVDWKVVRKEDGSVSCYIGVQELLTRSRWMVEINLPSDAVWLRTRSFWHNGSGAFQPYYSWTNSAVAVSDDMQIVFPAAYTIGHDGKVSPYPVDEAGRDLSQYARQGFGGSKSFHPGGSHKGWFGFYRTAEDAGMLHYALRDEKLGRKYFSWAQSDQGDIWVDLLTDNRPQYVELQSGRLFNQNMDISVCTPFKQFLFTPYGTDEWNEYWIPFAQTGGVDEVTLQAVVRLEQDGESARIRLYPLQTLDGRLTLEDGGGRILASRTVSLRPAQVAAFTFPVDAPAAILRLDGRRLWSADREEISRPTQTTPDFDLSSAQGQAVYARYLAGMRNYAEAEKKADRALELDPSLVPALSLKAMLCLRGIRYEEALSYADQVLAIDAYDPEANYIGGQAAFQLGRIYDAMDRFEVASVTDGLRSAAGTCLARIHFLRGDRDLAEEYARKSLVGNLHNMTAFQVLYQITADPALLEEMERRDPLFHFPDAERMLSGALSPEAFYASIQEEMKVQDYLEYAAFYVGMGLDDKALRLLEACPERNALTALWIAWLKRDPVLVPAAEREGLDGVFPFREESAAPLAWAVSQGGGWQSRYLLAVLKDFLGDGDAARALIQGNEADYAPYYAYRSRLTGSREDMRKALSLDPGQWRYIRDLARACYRDGDSREALALVRPYYKAHPDNFHIGDIYVKALIAEGRYEEADKVLRDIRILPFEGQGGSHVMYRDVKLHLAAASIDRGRYARAAARIAESREWPRNLGVGKPYDALVDSRAEDWLSAVLCARTGRDAEAAEWLAKVVEADPSGNWQQAFEKATVRTRTGYAPVTPLLGNLDASFDRKLF